MKPTICDAQQPGVPKSLTLYEYPVRCKQDLIGNKKHKSLNVFINPNHLPLQLEHSVEFVLSSDSNYAGGNMTLVVKELGTLDGGTYLVGYSPEADTEFYLVIKDRAVN